MDSPRRLEDCAPVHAEHLHDIPAEPLAHAGEAPDGIEEASDAEVALRENDEFTPLGSTPSDPVLVAAGNQTVRFTKARYQPLVMVAHEHASNGLTTIEEMLRLAGFDHGAIAERFGVAFVVRDCSVSYKSPARLDDLLEVRSRFLEMGGATLTAEQAICRDAAELARLEVRLACMDEGGRPSRIPGALREALAAYRGAPDPNDSIDDTTEERE